MDELGEIKRKNRLITVAGQRAYAKLESAGQPVEEYILLPGSVSGIIPKVHDLVTKSKTGIQSEM